MYSLVRASLTAVLIGLFVNVGSGSLADSRVAAPRTSAVQRSAAAGLSYTATAYCQSGITRSGVNTHSGIAAADPDELPVGSVVKIDTDRHEYNGIYTVLDTGNKVQGRKVDLYMRNCREATHFGKRPARVTVLRKGWSPKASAPVVVRKQTAEQPVGE